jgi:hypothetical protein
LTRSLAGFVTLHRSALESWLWELPGAQFKVAITILLLANWKEGRAFSGGALVTVSRGSFMCSLSTIGAQAKVSTQTTRTALRNLERCEFLTSQSTNRYRIITVLNYDKWQDIGEGPAKPINKQPTRRPHSEQQATNTPTNTDRTKQPITKGNTATREGTRPDAFGALADELWSEQETATAALRAEGIGKGTRALGLLNPAKAELVRRISERASTGSLQDARDDCQHVLAVLLVEARAKRTLKYLNGNHWAAKNFNNALSRKAGEDGRKRTSAEGMAERAARLEREGK